MRRSWLKNGVCFVMAVIFTCMLFVPYTAEAADSDSDEETVASSVTEIEIISYDETNRRSLAILSTSKKSANGEINGNGVRLRAKPSTSASVLELMYDGEKIWIDWDKYGTAGLSWYYIQRIKTGTYGWTSASYVCSLD